MKAILTIGIPGSGKSTWSKQFIQDNDYWIIERDDIRLDLFNLEHYNDYKMNRANEARVSEMADYLINNAASHKKNIVISDTNLNKKYRDVLIEKLQSLGYSVEFKVFDIEYFDAVRRNDKRKDKHIPRSVLYRMYRNYMSFLESEGTWEKYEPNPELPNAYIVDIDGTIADMHGARGPFEWDKVHLDKPIQNVIDIVNMLHSQGNKIIMLSGRDSVSRDLTVSWLFQHSVKCDKLYMRPEGSKQKDRYVKLVLFNKHLKGKYNILGVFDDRPQVALLWHDLGLTLFKIGDPIREF